VGQTVRAWAGRAPGKTCRTTNRTTRTDLVAEMRARVEAATRELDAATIELAERRAAVDELETVVDVLLGLTGTPVLVVDATGRVTALSRGAAERYPDTTIGGALPELAPDVDEHPLPGGGGVLVVPDA
jgi:hypothetical protein